MTKRIVVADDAAFMRNIVKNILETNGYQVVGRPLTAYLLLSSTRTCILTL